MCSECRKYPCDPRCPNAEDPAELSKCDRCGESIPVGASYYVDYEGHYFCCLDCAMYYYDIAEVDD